MCMESLLQVRGRDKYQVMGCGELHRSRYGLLMEWLGLVGIVNSQTALPMIQELLTCVYFSVTAVKGLFWLLDLRTAQ